MQPQAEIVPKLAKAAHLIQMKLIQNREGGAFWKSQNFCDFCGAPPVEESHALDSIYYVIIKFCEEQILI